MLDIDRMTLTLDETSLFKEKKKFMHSVFATSLQTDRGKNVVKEYKKDSNDQLVYSKLHRFHGAYLELMHQIC